MAYVYLHTGKVDMAKDVIAPAYQKMPDSFAVVRLGEAINKKASRKTR